MKKRMSQMSGLRGGRFKLFSFGVKVELMVFCLVTIGCYQSDCVVADGPAEQPKPKWPCYFVFGDSQADNGNNNKVSGLIARVDYKPYGIDFSDQDTPTGRFTNGRNVPDFIAEFLGFGHSIPPFKNTKHKNIENGVNYASGGSGILEETGRRLGEITSIDAQLENHNNIISKLHELMVNKSVESHLMSCIYTVQIGSNDYLNNYFLPRFYETMNQFDSLAYAIELNKVLSRQLTSLYDVGARKVVVFGVGAIGCSPYARRKHLRGEHSSMPCVDGINRAIERFNFGLKSLVFKLNAQLHEAKFTFIDVYKISTIDPATTGGMVLDTPCCNVLPGEIQCEHMGSVCENRNQYVFWDAVHPTEVAYKEIAMRSINAKHPDDCTPYDINKLLYL